MVWDPSVLIREIPRSNHAWKQGPVLECETNDFELE
jgi:hypothetical protein